MASAPDAGPIHLSDRSQEMVDAARRNAERAEVSDRINLECHVVSHLKGRDTAGMVVTNPPYGKRVGRSELNGLYSRLGAVVRERLPQHGLVVLTPDAKLAKSADGRVRSSARFRHGGLPVEIFARSASPADAPSDTPSVDAPGESANETPVNAIEQ